MGQQEILQLLKNNPDKLYTLKEIQRHFNVGRGHYIKAMQTLRHYNLVSYSMEEGATLRKSKEYKYGI